MNAPSILSEETERLLSALSLPVMVLDTQQRFVFANAPYLDATHKTLDELLGQRVFDVFPDTPERMDAVGAKFAHTLATGETTQLDAQPFKLQFEDGSWRDLVWQATQDAVRDASGAVVGLIQHPQDITRQVELQRRNNAIGIELNHRVKNIMAVVTSIARITSRGVDSVPEFTRSFIDRLSSISRTNESLARGEWRGLTVAEAFQSALQPYGEDGSVFTLSGPKVRLSLDATKDVAMVAHELATNAVKYGCLSDHQEGEGSSLDIRWTMEDGVLRIHWTETCAHPIDIPATPGRGFGTRLFEMLPYIDVAREFRPEGLALTITVEGEAAFA